MSVEIYSTILSDYYIKDERERNEEEGIELREMRNESGEEGGKEESV